MPKLPRWTTLEAERALTSAGFELLRSKAVTGSTGSRRVTLPFHSGVTLHPKIVKQVLEAIEDAGQNTTPEDNDR